MSNVLKNLLAIIAFFILAQASSIGSQLLPHLTFWKVVLTIVTILSYLIVLAGLIVAFNDLLKNVFKVKMTAQNQEGLDSFLWLFIFALSSLPYNLTYTVPTAWLSAEAKEYNQNKENEAKIAAQKKMNEWENEVKDKFVLQPFFKYHFLLKAYNSVQWPVVGAPGIALDASNNNTFYTFNNIDSCLRTMSFLKKIKESDNYKCERAVPR